MNRNDLLVSAEERIRQHRTADVELHLSDATGRALPNVRVDLQLTRHEFKFGCNAYMLGSIPDTEHRCAYEQRFTALLNYATLPFYWSGYEQSEGVTQEERLQRMAAWCEHNRMSAKGHPLVWHETFPEWGKAYSDNVIVSRLEGRVREIVSRFKDAIQIWDVVNEATVAHRVDNTVGRWIAREGAATCVGRALSWAREANPSATLLYNDFNISDDFETLVGSLRERGAPIDVIGIQSHMHRGPWPLERVWHVCETYARYGLPLHWTETTVLSGRWKTQDDDDWGIS